MRNLQQFVLRNLNWLHFQFSDEALYCKTELVCTWAEQKCLPVFIKGLERKAGKCRKSESTRGISKPLAF